MTKRNFFTVLILVVFLTGCFNNVDNINVTGIKSIKIAVFKNSSAQQKYFQKGIERAYKDVLEEYKDSNVNIECDFYENVRTYEDVDTLTKKIVEDRQLTAIIGSDNPEAAKNQLYTTEKNNKIFISPGRMYDRSLTAENDLFFYMSYSSENIGKLFKKISETLPNINWAVCSTTDDISRSEVKAFRTGNLANVVDYTNMEDLSVHFDKTIKTWKSLNVEGVIMIPRTDDGFALIYKLKEAMPDIYILTDSDMDNQPEYDKNPDKFKDFYIADNFTVTKHDKKYIEYTKTHDVFEDTWEIHGYNTFRMIVDTAIKNKVYDPEKISFILHESGYKGLGESFEFKKNGTLKPTRFSYINLSTGEISEIPYSEVVR